jgi:hypothetical protein
VANPYVRFALPGTTAALTSPSSRVGQARPVAGAAPAGQAVRGGPRFRWPGELLNRPRWASARLGLRPESGRVSGDGHVDKAHQWTRQSDGRAPGEGLDGQGLFRSDAAAHVGKLYRFDPSSK